MKQYVLKNRKIFLSIISIFQIAGGALMFYLIYNGIRPNAPGQFLALFPMLIINLISFIAGFFYFIYGERTRFFLLSKLNFCLQIIQFSVDGLKFSYCYGPYLSIGVDGEYNFLFNFELLKAFFSLGFGKHVVGYFFALNLVPILPLVILRWVERNPAKNEELENAFLEKEPAP